jgi:hypothetical protein
VKEFEMFGFQERILNPLVERTAEQIDRIIKRSDDIALTVDTLCSLKNTADSDFRKLESDEQTKATASYMLGFIVACCPNSRAAQPKDAGVSIQPCIPEGAKYDKATGDYLLGNVNPDRYHQYGGEIQVTTTNPADGTTTSYYY